MTGEILVTERMQMVAGIVVGMDLGGAASMMTKAEAMGEDQQTVVEVGAEDDIKTLMRQGISRGL